MKKSVIARIVLYSVLLVLLLGILIAGMAVYQGNENFSKMIGIFYAEEDYAEENMDYEIADPGTMIPVPAEEITEIEVDWISGSVTVEPAAVSSISLNETVTENPMVYGVKDGRLMIRFTEKMPPVSFLKNVESKHLTVQVPESWMGRKVEVRAVSAEVNISDLQLSEVEYEGVSGKFQLRGCKLGKLEAETVSGDIIVQGEIRELECESVSANCDLSLQNVPHKISMDGVSGNLNLILPGDAGFTLDIDGISRKFETDFPVTGKDGKYTAGSGSCEIEINGVSGWARIQKAG